MNPKLKSIIKIVLGLLLVVGGFPALINALFIVIGGATSDSSDSYNLGRAVGGLVGSLAVWILGLWLLLSWYKQRKLAKQASNTENASSR